jgi:hypothetical protein
MEGVEEELAVAIVFEDGSPGVAADGDVVESAGIFDAQRPGHARGLARRVAEFKKQDLTPRRLPECHVQFRVRLIGDPCLEPAKDREDAEREDRRRDQRKIKADAGEDAIADVIQIEAAVVRPRTVSPP